MSSTSAFVSFCESLCRFSEAKPGLFSKRPLRGQKHQNTTDSREPALEGCYFFGLVVTKALPQCFQLLPHCSILQGRPFSQYSEAPSKIATPCNTSRIHLLRHELACPHQLPLGLLQLTKLLGWQRNGTWWCSGTALGDLVPAGYRIACPDRKTMLAKDHQGFGLAICCLVRRARQKTVTQACFHVWAAWCKFRES